MQENLAGILAIASNAKSPRPEGQGLSQLKAVAGTRFHLNLRDTPIVTPRMEGSPVRDWVDFTDLFRAAA